MSTPPNNDENKMRDIAVTLGVMNYLCRFCVFVEGKHDVSFLKWINKIPELKEIIDLEEHGVEIFDLNGSNLKNWVQVHLAKDNNGLKSNIVAFHLCDKDSDEKYKRQVEAINQDNSNSKAKLTDFREMENYCCPRLIEREFQIKFEDKQIKDWKSLDVPKVVASLSSKKEDAVKSIINGKLSKSITKNSLEEIGAWEEVKSWFETIKTMNDSL